MDGIQNPKKSTDITELNSRKKLYIDPKYKKVKVSIEITMYLESDKIDIDYAHKCAKYLLDEGKDRAKHKLDDGKNIFQDIKFGQVQTYKYD